ncbi:MAG: methyltransferase domain-containing protein [Chryseolinea sp.]
MDKSEQRAEMPKGKNSVLDRRTVVNGNANLLKIIRRDDHVLDVGCGSGAITKDIASLVGAGGSVLGIDSSVHLIEQAKNDFAKLPNLSFEVADIKAYSADKLMDVVTSARVLQWLSHPAEVVIKLTSLVKPGGWLTILDYNHEKVEFNPPIPPSMQLFYNNFLQWRSDAGMDNGIADNLKDIFAHAGLVDITEDDYAEVSISGKQTFLEEIDIWIKVAEGRGPQLVKDGYITESERLLAITDYGTWIKNEAKYMKLYLKAVTGRKV